MGIHKSPADMNVAFCRALGLDPSTTGTITIVLSPQAFPAVTVEHVNVITDEFIHVIERYLIIERDDLDHPESPIESTP